LRHYSAIAGLPQRTGSVTARKKRAYTEQLSNLKMTLTMPKEE